MNHLVKVISRFTGPVSVRRHEEWVLEISPVEKLHQFNRRIETLSQMNKAGVLDLSGSLSRLRAPQQPAAAFAARGLDQRRTTGAPLPAQSLGPLEPEA